VKQLDIKRLPQATPALADAAAFQAALRSSIALVRGRRRPPNYAPMDLGKSRRAALIVNCGEKEGSMKRKTVQ
jgi:hypothetical protein